MRELRSEPRTGGPAVESGSPPATAGASLALAGLTDAAVEIERFWSSPPLPHRPAVLPVDADLLLRQLPPPAPALGGDALVRRLSSAYSRFAARDAGDF